MAAQRAAPACTSLPRRGAPAGGSKGTRARTHSLSRAASPDRRKAPGPGAAAAPPSRSRLSPRAARPKARAHTKAFVRSAAPAGSPRAHRAKGKRARRPHLKFRGRPTPLQRRASVPRRASARWRAPRAHRRHPRLARPLVVHRRRRLRHALHVIARERPPRARRHPAAPSHSRLAGAPPRPRSPLRRLTPRRRPRHAGDTRAARRALRRSNARSRGS